MIGVVGRQRPARQASRRLTLTSLILLVRAHRHVATKLVEMDLRIEASPLFKMDRQASYPRIDRAPRGEHSLALDPLFDKLECLPRCQGLAGK